VASLSSGLTSALLGGTTNVSSLVKSAASLTYDQQEAEDDYQAGQFELDHSDASYQAYASYLKDRISQLNSENTGEAMIHAASLTNDLQNAQVSNASYDLDLETGQVLNGDASDQDKLNYLQSAAQKAYANGDVDQATTFLNDAGNLQQSIEYDAQVSQEEATTATDEDVSAISDGLTADIDNLEADFSTLTQLYNAGSTSKNQLNGMIKQIEASPVIQAAIQSGDINIPKGATMTMQTLTQAMFTGEHLMYDSAYEQLSAIGTPDAIDRASDIQADIAKLSSGGKSITTPFGTINATQAAQLSSEPTNLNSQTVSASGKVTNTQNAVTGYTPTTETNLITGGKYSGYNLQTKGSPTTPFGGMTENQRAALQNKLQAMGFTPSSGKGTFDDTSTSVGVHITSQALKSLGVNPNSPQGKALTGMNVTLVPHGEGFEFVSGTSGPVFGISFDDRGRGALYQADGTNQFKLVGAQYGFNPKTATNNGKSVLQTAIPQSLVQKGLSDVKSFLGVTGVQNKGPQMTQRAGGGFNFTNAQGKAISAATYSKLTGIAFRTLLETMATKGDAGAQQVLGFVGNNYMYDPTKINSGSNAAMYNSMTWGMEPNAVAKTPTAAPMAATGKAGSLSLPSGVKL